MRSATRPGGDPPRLGVADHAADAATELQADLGQLGRLAGAGLAGHDHDLVVADGGGDVVPALADRQLVRVGECRHRGAAGGQARLRLRDLALDRGQIQPLAGQPAREAPLVEQAHPGQSFTQRR